MHPIPSSKILYNKHSALPFLLFFHYSLSLIMNRIAFLAALLILTILVIAAPVEKRRTKYSGRGTWFTPSNPSEGGDTGACGGHLNDDAMIIALVS